jgi:N-methylhydantoinase A/oxoprolinase/acetone carboxylase beta subunit
MDGQTVLASQKMPTTDNVSDGIVGAIRHILTESKVPTTDIQCVMIGTTHFTNAFVERKGLSEVGVIRIALPASRGIPPLSDWPKELANAIGKNVTLVRGGYQVDGRINSELDELAIRDAANQFRSAGITAVAITGLFSPVNDYMEIRAEEIVRNEMPDASVTRSARIGRLGMLERENATIMNASLADMSTKVVSSFRSALSELEITAPFYISQNDGTLMAAEAVEDYPVLTFASGPTNSMRGAAYLSGVKDALVVDIGGTTTDIGMLVNGFPRESSVTVDIGGVRTNFRMPDILAVGLGGGSVVSESGESLSIGPQSVGFRLLQEGMCFGGETLTASDVAVAAGYASMGDSSRVSGLPKSTIDAAVAEIHRIVAEGVDRMKTSADRLPLVLVGGGSVLVNQDIPGTSEAIVPEHAAVANAIGASIAQIGGEIDTVFYYDEVGRDGALETARNSAETAAIEAGADPGTVEITDIEEVPLAYVPGGAVRLRVRAAGDLTL